MLTDRVRIMKRTHLVSTAIYFLCLVLGPILFSAAALLASASRSGSASISMSDLGLVLFYTLPTALLASLGWFLAMSRFRDRLGWNRSSWGPASSAKRGRALAART